jgi:hypothetical protein
MDFKLFKCIKYELPDGNNQEKLILAAFDRVLVSTSWDSFSHLRYVKALPHQANDHVTL